MGHRQDWFEPIRRLVWPVLDPLLKPFGGYSMGSVGPSGYVGMVGLSDEELEEVFHEMGFKRNFIASLKHRVAPHDAVDISEGSWAWRNERFSTWQIHATFFVAEDGSTAVYAHKEYNWHRHPIKHVKGIRVRHGPAIQFVKSKLSEHGVHIE